MYISTPRPGLFWSWQSCSYQTNPPIENSYLCRAKYKKQLLEGTIGQPKLAEETLESRGHLEDSKGTGWVFRFYGLSTSGLGSIDTKQDAQNSVNTQSTGPDNQRAEFRATSAPGKLGGMAWKRRSHKRGAPVLCVNSVQISNRSLKCGCVGQNLEQPAKAKALDKDYSCCPLQRR